MNPRRKLRVESGCMTYMAIISAEKKAELLRLKQSDITFDRLVKLFGYTTKKNTETRKMEIVAPYFITSERVHLDPKEYINEEEENTNVGIILFNKLLIENMIEDVIPGRFFNDVITKSSFEKILNYIGAGIMDRKISMSDPSDTRLYRFFKAYECWALKCPAIFSPSYTLGVILPNKDVMKEKEKLLKDNPTTVEDIAKMEDKLVDLAKVKTEGDPGRTLFDSGARGSFSNDYKNMSIMVGSVMNPITHQYDLMTSNYIDGISKKDLPAAGNVVVTSEYPKAIGTARGGYITKQFYAAFQGITLDKHGSDCGTKKGLNIVITEDHASSFIDQYVMVNGKPILLSPENINSFIGKRVLLRSPMYCIGDKYCNICMGERYYKVSIDAVGLTSTRMSNELMKKNLKLRHNMKVKLTHIDANSVLVADRGSK